MTAVKNNIFADKLHSRGHHGVFHSLLYRFAADIQSAFANSGDGCQRIFYHMVARERYAEIQRAVDYICAAYRLVNNAAGGHIRHCEPIFLAPSGFFYNTACISRLLGIHDRHAARLDYSAFLRGYFSDCIAEYRGVIHGNRGYDGDERSFYNIC